MQAEAHSANTIKSALGMMCWEGSCFSAKPSILLIVACVLPRDERGNAALSRLYFLGYVTVYPRHTSNAPSGLSKLCSIPTARNR